MGPDLSSRHAPTVIFVMPLRAVGNSAACQPKSLLLRQRFGIALRRIEHHLDDAFDITVGGSQPADIHAEAARDRRAHLLPVENLAFNFARFG